MTPPLRVLMAECAELVATALRADSVYVSEIEPGGETLVVRAAFGEPADTVGAELRSQYGEAFRSGDPVVVSGVSGDTASGASTAGTGPDAMSGASVAIRQRGRNYGVLGVHARGE